jgi:hypothetical protein
MNADKTLKQGLKWMKTPEGQKSIENYFNKLAQRDAIKRSRAHNIIKRWGVCDDATFDDLMLTILEKQSKYDERHYSTYYDRPLHIMNLMWEIASNEGLEIDPIDDFTENFSSRIYFYYGYQFAITHGQGSVLSVYRQTDLRYRS